MTGDEQAQSESVPSWGEIALRIVLTYILLLTIYSLVAWYIRTVQPLVPGWVFGRQTVEKLSTLEGLRFIAYCARRITFYSVPVYGVFIGYGLIARVVHKKRRSRA